MDLLAEVEISKLLGTLLPGCRCHDRIHGYGADMDEFERKMEFIIKTVSDTAVIQQRCKAILEDLAARAAEMSERESRTNERLNALRNLVEGYGPDHPQQS